MSNLDSNFRKLETESRTRPDTCWRSMCRKQNPLPMAGDPLSLHYQEISSNQTQQSAVPNHRCRGAGMHNLSLGFSNSNGSTIRLAYSLIVIPGRHQSADGALHAVCCQPQPPVLIQCSSASQYCLLITPMPILEIQFQVLALKTA